MSRSLLELRLGEQEIVEGLHVLYSRIAESVKQPMTGLPGIAKWQSCYVAADSLLREWPGPVRITWVPSAENATVKSVYCERDAKLAVEARQLKESLQVLPLQGRWLKLVTEMNEY